MISLKELMSGNIISDIPINQQHNLEDLQKAVNLVREKWGKPMVVTSGYRSMSEHLRIYSVINARRRAENLPPVKVPLGSAHLSGNACDISDPNLALTEWLKQNPSVLADAGLWCEEGNSNWVHFQIVPPVSGHRWFLP